jgi:dipeptidyl aminopeptidase/acylaminoacyl peptidase
VTRSAAPGPRATLPVRLGPVGRWLAPALAIAGLLVIALITLDLLQGGVPFVGTRIGSGGGGGGNGAAGPLETPAPVNVVVVPPDVVSFPGTIVYAKAGNIWVQTGKQAHQLTTGGNDAMPSFSADGKTVYFVRTVNGIGHWPSSGVVRDYQMTIPNVMQVAADGSGDPSQLLSGKVSKNGWSWHAWIRQPVLSPDGKTLAMVSDRPDPSNSDVVLQFYDISSKKTTVPKLAEEAPLGHQDPTWRPDGKVLLYVHNGRDGARGAPSIYRWDAVKGKATALTGPGYLEPSFSPDGRYVAATKTSSFGNDLVILDASNGRELLRLTNDGASWAPAWSPLGDSIAFLHIQGQLVDLELVRLDGTAPGWTVKDVIPLTEVSGLDGESRPGWFVPADQLPTPTATPAATPAASPASSAGGSTAP